MSCICFKNIEFVNLLNEGREGVHIVCADLERGVNENIGDINFPNAGRRQAITQNMPARQNETKKANIARKIVEK